MENLTLAIDQAIPSNDYARLTAIFAPTAPASDAASSSSSSLSWHSVGQGKKRSLAAYFISAAVASPTL
jgi:glycerol dehydrogenase-like iron-containing ADH family enzyme